MVNNEEVSVMDNSDLIGRIAGVALTKLNGMPAATGIYYKAVEILTSGEVQAVCTNPGLTMSARPFPADRFRRQLRQEVVQGQLAPVEAEVLDYVAKCYLTERQSDETDEHLKDRLVAIALGPQGMH